MPGHILRATCCCGFQRELYLGNTRIAGDWVPLAIAYNVDESDLLTRDKITIESQKLRIIPDPFTSDEPAQPLDKATLVKHLSKPWPPREEHGPYLCPQCKAVSMKLQYAGVWD
jgi:hypothetical protein